MTKRFAFILTALFGLLLAVPAWSQTATVKGTVLDRDGKPMTGAIVEFKNLENGQTYKIKVDKKGNYFSIGSAAPSKYNVRLLINGQQVYNLNNVRVQLSDDNVFDMKLNEEAQHQEAQAAGIAPKGQQPGQTAPQKLTPEQQNQLDEYRKAQEAQAKEASTVKNLNGLMAQAQAAKQAGQLDQAIATMQQASQMDATRDLIWAKLGEFELEKARTDAASRMPMATGAIEAYKKAIELCTATPTATSCKDVAGYHNNLGQAYAMSGHAPEAIQEYNAAAQANPAGAGQYYYNEGAVLTNTGKVDEANAAFAKAIQADP